MNKMKDLWSKNWLMLGYNPEVMKHSLVAYAVNSQPLMEAFLGAIGLTVSLWVLIFC